MDRWSHTHHRDVAHCEGVYNWTGPFPATVDEDKHDLLGGTTPSAPAGSGLAPDERPSEQPSSHVQNLSVDQPVTGVAFFPAPLSQSPQPDETGSASEDARQAHADLTSELVEIAGEAVVGHYAALSGDARAVEQAEKARGIVSFRQTRPSTLVP